MKSFVLIAVLAALTVCNDALSILNEVPRYQEDNVDFFTSGQEFQRIYNPEGSASSNQFQDKDLILFLEESCDEEAISDQVQNCYVVFVGNSTTQINKITVSNAPVYPGNLRAGNSWTHGFVNLTSAPGAKLFSTVRFLGRYTDWL